MQLVQSRSQWTRVDPHSHDWCPYNVRGGTEIDTKAVRKAMWKWGRDRVMWLQAKDTKDCWQPPKLEETGKDSSSELPGVHGPGQHLDFIFWPPGWWEKKLLLMNFSLRRFVTSALETDMGGICPSSLLAENQGPYSREKLAVISAFVCCCRYQLTLRSLLLIISSLRQAKAENRGDTLHPGGWVTTGGCSPGGGDRKSFGGALGRGLGSFVRCPIADWWKLRLNCLGVEAPILVPQICTKQMSRRPWDQGQEALCTPVL